MWPDTGRGERRRQPSVAYFNAFPSTNLHARIGLLQLDLRHVMRDSSELRRR